MQMRKLVTAGLITVLAAVALADPQNWYGGNPQSDYRDPNVPQDGHTGAFAPPAKPAAQKKHKKKNHPKPKKAQRGDSPDTSGNGESPQNAVSGQGNKPAQPAATQ